MNKQPNSRMCFICGVKNIAGVHVRFYEPGDGTVQARFTGQEIHQGYPGRFHGGVLAGITGRDTGAGDPTANTATTSGASPPN